MMTSMGKNKDKASANADADTKSKKRDDELTSSDKKKVAEQLREQARQQGLEDAFSEILVPTEDVVEIRRGRKVNSERKFFPGYVLVKMEMTDDAYHLVKNTPKVTGFLGSSGKPQPISDAEAARMLNSKEEAAAAPKHKVKVDY